jgi:hypothetical protein
MTQAGFEALQDAVRVARDRQITSVRVLRHVLKGMGHDDAVISEALTTWGQHCRRSGALS